MNILVWTYIAYLAISISLTIWVGKTLHKNGSIFLIECFDQNKELANSVNHLLVVGFYLINAGYISLALKHQYLIKELHSGIEVLSSKVGLVLLVLGSMHFFNLYILNKLRKKSQLKAVFPPTQPNSY